MQRPIEFITTELVEDNPQIWPDVSSPLTAFPVDPLGLGGESSHFGPRRGVRKDNFKFRPATSEGKVSVD